MKRRDFMKLSALASAGLALRDMPGSAQPPTTTTVSLVKSGDRSQAVKKAIPILGVNPVKGKHVVLKPNFNSAHPFPGSTHNDTLRALIEHLRDLGASSFQVADRSGMGSTRTVMQQKGIFTMATAMGFQAVVIDELARSAWAHFPMSGMHWRRGLYFPQMFIEAESIVQTCCLKTHRYGGHFTLSLKNSVGMVAKYSPVDNYDFMSELHSSANQRLMIAEINLLYKPDLIILDAIQGFANAGPETGKLVSPGVIIAGTDRVAIDAIGVAILRLMGTTVEVASGSIFAQQQIRRAVELGIGVDAPEKIDVVVTDKESWEFAQTLTSMLNLSVQMLVRPRLRIARRPDGVTVSWPTAEGQGCKLMSAENLAGNPVNWTEVTEPVTVEGEQSTVTIPINRAQAYYRLAR
jgi:uncharacterized protein (DUF362 family)